MKNIKIFSILLFFSSIASAQISMGNSIIFESNGNIAVPIVIYQNGKYTTPPWYPDDPFSPEEEKEVTKLINQFKKVLSKYDSLFSLNDGVKYKAIKIIGIPKWDSISMTHPSFDLEISPMHKLLSTNPKLGTNKFKPLEKNDRPFIYNRRIINPIIIKGKTEVEDISIYPISKVDIDGDGITEIIYEISMWELSFYQIYSKKNGKWKKVFQSNED